MVSVSTKVSLFAAAVNEHISFGNQLHRERVNK